MFFLLSVSTPDGEQKPFIFLSRMVDILVYGVMILSIITVPLYPKWVKEKWIINLSFFCLSSFLIYLGTRNQVRTQYSESIIKLDVNSKEYIKKIEYYGEYNKVRSISFTCKNKKDSIWTTFDEDGSLIKQEKYKDDTLVEKIK